MKGLLITFPDNTTMNVEYIKNTLVINENYYKALKPVDNNCKLDVVFSVELSNKLKWYTEENIPANVFDDNENIIFAGYLRKTFSFVKKQRNQPISLEIVSPSFVLDKELTSEVFKTNESVGAIVNALGTQAGFTLRCSLSATVPYFRAKKGDNIYSTIEKLLFEHGYTFDFNNSGTFVLYPLFNAPTQNNITHAFTGYNCLDQIDIKRTEKQYSGVVASWQKKEFIQETMLYEDTSGATTTSACTIEVGPQSYMYGNDNTEGKHYLQFDSTKGEVLYASNIWPVVSGTYIDSLQTSYENCGDSVLWKAFNPSMTITATYHKFQWWGRAWVATSKNETKTSVINDKSLSLNISYLNDDLEIASFIKKVADYYRYALFNLTVKSKDNISIGSFVTVEDNGIGKTTGRIVSKKSDYTGVFTYTIESVSDFEPATLDESKSEITRNPSDGFTSNIATLKSITDSLQEQISSIEQVGTTCQLDLSSVTLEIDDEGFTQTVQSFSTFVTLKRSEMDLDFNIGNADNPLILPDGWSVVIEGNKLTFTVGEGIQVTAGYIKIPVVYVPVLSDDPFVDENDEPFVDENNEPFRDVIYGEGGTVWNLYLNYIGNGYGKFLGTFTTLAQIQNCNPNISDYFVWGGENRITSAMAYEGFFRQAQTYKYIGTGKTWSWQADTNSGHMQAALSDVLAIANADLKNNNSTVWAYLDHLTANSVYADMLVANEAFIDKIGAKIITADLVTTDVLATTLQAYEKIADLQETLQAYDTIEARNSALNNYIQTTSLFGSDGHVLSSFATESISNAIVNGETVIKNGFINTNCLNADVVTTQYLEGGSASFTGIVKSPCFALETKAGNWEVDYWNSNNILNTSVEIPCHGVIKIKLTKSLNNLQSVKLYKNGTLISESTELDIDVTVTEADLLTLEYEYARGSAIVVDGTRFSIMVETPSPILKYLLRWK